MTPADLAILSLKEAVDEIHVLRAELARISEELGLPPTIGPAPGYLKRWTERLAELHEQTRVRDARVEPPVENDDVLVFVDDCNGWEVMTKTGTHWMTLTTGYFAIETTPFYLPMPPNPDAKP